MSRDGLIDVRFSDLTKLFEKEVGERRDILQAAVSFYRKVRVSIFMSKMLNFFYEYLILNQILK